MTKSWLPLPETDEKDYSVSPTGKLSESHPHPAQDLTYEEATLAELQLHGHLLKSIRVGVWVLASLAIAGVIWGIIDATIIAVNISQTQF